MNGYKKMKKYQFCLLALLFFNLSFGTIIHKSSKGILPPQKGTYYKYELRIISDGLISPDRIEPTIIIKDFDPDYFPVDKMPKPLEGYTALWSQLGYTRLTNDQNAFGFVMVHALIDENGFVKKCILAKELSRTLKDDMLLDMINKTHFEPARRDNEPVDAWIGIPFRFELRKNIGK